MYLAYGLSLGLLLAACADQGQAPSPPTPTPQPSQSAGAPATVPIDAAQASRMQGIMGPLIQHMNEPIPPAQVKMTVLDDEQINAANGGGGDFYVTTGLLKRGSDDQIRAIMAHEIAHADLHHVAKLGAIATGLDLGFGLLDQVLPGSRVLAPIAGQLITSSYSRSEEGAADAHGVTILKRTGYDGKKLMIDMLSWLQRTTGNGSGSFFSSHPGTDDRIRAVRDLP